MSIEVGEICRFAFTSCKAICQVLEKGDNQLIVKVIRAGINSDGHNDLGHNHFLGEVIKGSISSLVALSPLEQLAFANDL